MFTQDEYFAKIGGDSYFYRNLARQREPRRVPRFHSSIVDLAANRNKAGSMSVLGGASGVEAIALSTDLPGWSVSNVDISGDAIAFGRTNFPSINHFQASVADPTLPGRLGSQDVVVAMAVLLWVGREALAQTLSNIHLLLRVGGILAIHDYFPPRSIKNEIEHSPGYFTYKEDYSNLFLASGNFRLIEKTVWEEEEEGYGWEDRLIGHAFLEKLN